jgi:pimeloyl-ACP methyl ester carboxylesterase
LYLSSQKTVMKRMLCSLWAIVLLSTWVYAQDLSKNFTEKEWQMGSLGGMLTVAHQPISMDTAVLLIAGSGPTDRDGNQAMMQNNSLRFLAEGWSNAGFTVFRFDKRGVGSSASVEVKEADIRFQDFVSDVVAWGNKLQTEGYTHLVLAGHSEGALVATMAAQQLKGVIGVISLSGAGRPASSVIRSQLLKQPKEVQDLAFPVLDSLVQGKQVSEVSPWLWSLFRPSVQPYLISWFALDPAVEVARLEVPVLVTQGDQDLQVMMEDAQLLAQAHRVAFLAPITGMNHVLKQVNDDDVQDNWKSYTDPSRPIHPELLQRTLEFLKSLKTNKK